jgi:hypothetical protein
MLKISILKSLDILMKLKNQDAFKNLVGLNLLNNLLIVSLRSVRHQITPYSRFGAFAPRSGPELDEDSMRQLAVAKKYNQPDTPAPPNRIAASRFAPLGWWGVVNTTTLSETSESGRAEESAIGKFK